MAGGYQLFGTNREWGWGCTNRFGILVENITGIGGVLGRRCQFLFNLGRACTGRIDNVGGATCIVGMDRVIRGR